MPMVWGGSRSAWDFSDKANWAINKPLAQNIREAGTGLQIMGTVIPEALAYKAAQQITAQLASRAAVAATETAAGATAGAGGIGAGGAMLGASLIPLATTGLKVGFDVFLLEWLQKNWWIPALLIGAYMGVKLIK
jgi:hypothetical protein